MEQPTYVKNFLQLKKNEGRARIRVATVYKTIRSNFTNSQTDLRVNEIKSIVKSLDGKFRVSKKDGLVICFPENYRGGWLRWNKIQERHLAKKKQLRLDRGIKNSYNKHTLTGCQ